MPVKKVAFQGVKGAFSWLATNAVFPSAEKIGFETFEEVLKAIETHKVTHGMLPIENYITGRIANVHRLIANSKVKIIGEHFQKISHCLIAKKGAKFKAIKKAFSHVEALSQCKDFLQKHKIEAIPFFDTAGAVELVSSQNDFSISAIASGETEKLYVDVEILKTGIQSEKNNVTRFLSLSLAEKEIKENAKNVITSISFKLKNAPASLVKALSCFSDLGINIISIESFVSIKDPKSAFFYVEVEGNSAKKPLKSALIAIDSAVLDVKILGSYERSE